MANLSGLIVYRISKNTFFISTRKKSKDRQILNIMKKMKYFYIDFSKGKIENQTYLDNYLDMQTG